MEPAHSSFGSSAAAVRVLHIDDDPTLTALVGRRLAAYGIEIDALNDERRWEENLATGAYRVVLLDIDMPYRDGLQVLRDLKRYDGTIQVIMLTGIVRTHLILEALRDGAEYCFFKPLEDLEPLAQAIMSTSKRVDHWREAVRFARSELDKLQSKPELAPALAT
jgi:DNA-binding response OmpR family regulator